MFFMLDKVKSISCCIQNIGKILEVKKFPTSWIYRMDSEILREYTHTIQRREKENYEMS